MEAIQRVRTRPFRLFGASREVLLTKRFGRGSTAGDSGFVSVHDGLLENEACPACGHTGWSPSAVSVSRPPYTRALAPILPKAEAERLFGAELRCCDACDSSYPGVWLSEDMAGLLYSVIEGQHTFGWKRMLTSLDAGDRTRIGEIEAANHAAVEAFIGPVRRYAEVKCPFAGRYPFLPRDDGGARYVSDGFSSPTASGPGTCRSAGRSPWWRSIRSSPRGARAG